jgi:hypothetical protein
MAMSSARTRPCEEGIIKSTSLAVNRQPDAKPWVLLAAILASSIANIDESIVKVALPAIETDLVTSVPISNIATTSELLGLLRSYFNNDFSALETTRPIR